MQKHRLFPFPNSSVYHCLTQQDLTQTHTHGTEIPNVIISYLMITAHQQRLHPFITSAAGAPPHQALETSYLSTDHSMGLIEPY